MSDDGQYQSYATLRRPVTAPDLSGFSFSYNPRHTVEILHPGYSDRDNVLFAIHAPDASEGGLIYDFVHTVAAIATGNQFQGYFSRTRLDSRIHVARNTILKAGRYYFHTGACCDGTTTTHIRYPVVPNFQSWQFPHDCLPPAWIGPFKNIVQEENRGAEFSNISGAVASRDTTCRATAVGLGVEAAHLCPKVCDEWFRLNRMDRFNRVRGLSASAMVDDLSNLVLLRADVHKLLDSRRLVFFPKKDKLTERNSVRTNKWTLVIHTLEAHKELVQSWHNREVYELRGVAPEHLFTRFAHSIFGFLEGYILCGVERVVLVPGIDGEPQSQIWSPAECMAMMTSCSGSRSPRKRKALEQPNPPPRGFADRDGTEHKHKRQRTRIKSRHSGNRLPKCPDMLPCSPTPVLLATSAAAYAPQPRPGTSTAHVVSTAEQTQHIPPVLAVLPTEPSCPQSSTDVESAPLTQAVDPACSSPPAQITPITPLQGDDDRNISLEQNHDTPSIISTASNQHSCDTNESPQLPPSTLDALIASHLEDERRHSDTKGTWKEQQSWAMEMLERTMTSDEAARVWSILGGGELVEPG